MTHRFAALLLSLIASLATVTLAPAANITWSGGNGTWSDGAGNDANWTPADEPDTNDLAIFSTNNLITMGTNNQVIGVTMSASSQLELNGNDLTVDGDTLLTGSGTRLVVAGADAALNAQDIILLNDAVLFLDGGAVNVFIPVAPIAVVTTSAGGTLSGNGEIAMNDVFAGVTTTINNNGEILASNPSLIILTPPAAATLHFSTADVDARIDLDGSLEGGVVTVSRNQTLDIDITLADIFNGGITMTHNTKLDIASAWILGAGAIVNIDNGAVGGLGGAPASTATIAGSSFSQNSGTITVVDADGTLQFDAPFTMNGGTLANNGLVVFNSSTTIANAANFTMPTTSSSITVAANRVVNINQASFNLDGANAATNVITVNDGAVLTINTGDYDTDSATNAFDGTVNLVNGTIDITTGDAEFVMDGVLNASASGIAQSLWSGEALDIGNDAGVLDADVNITGSQPTQFGAQVDFNSDADLNVADGTSVHFLDTVNFNSVNAANNAEFTGSGEIIFSAGVNFSETTHLNFVGGTVDLDGADSIGDTINIDAPLTINAELMRSFGKNNGGGGVNLLDVNNSINAGTLTVNLDSADAEWTLNAQGTINLINDNTEATLLAGSAVNVNGTVNVTGDVRTTARLDIGSTAIVNINTAGQPLRLAGGNSGPDVNTISGGTITGVGQLGADTGKALHGYGTINADIAFVGSANLRASGGTLTLGGDIVDVNILGTADDTGVLNITNAWESDGGAGGSIGAVVLDGGTLQGAQITNDNANGLQGHGTITSRVINTSKIVATNGGTLIVQTAGNDNDWDGAANTGELEALSGDLEMIDTTGPVPPVRQFGGKVRAINDNRVYANGFGLDFNPGSSLTLEDEATYRASSSTDLGGAVTIGAGADATIEVTNNFFLTFEPTNVTTLGGDLTLKNNNINIEDGASITGSGALKIPDGSHLVVDNQADVGVLLEMRGAFRPGNFNGIGRVNLTDYQQFDTGELYVEMIGTGLNQFDRLTATGDVIVDGYLNIDIDEIAPMVPFVPVLGNTFNIITSSISVTGQFDYYDVSGMPPGLAFKINYLGNAVQLQVVNKPIFSADFDDDGDVDPTDLAIWRGAFHLNQLGDADGDNDSDGADFLLWQRQLGSKPTAVAAAAAVPEPSAAVLAAGVFAFLAALSRRRRELGIDCV